MTMHDDDDQLAAFDLAAWDVPPPALGLVDAVLERARQPAPVAALDSGERIGTPVRGMRRWWIAATVAAVAIVAILVGVWGVQRTPKNGQGEVIATSARTLDIGPTTAALDAGTQVRWRRDKRTLSVAQPRGEALWTVAADDTLVIDAGAMGATVEASGASLRVEVKMNASDTRAVGVSAATAIAVALVTIVVYEGTVRVRHDGQTVKVVPGAQYEIRPPQPPEPITVGGGPVDQRVGELEDEVKRLEAERDELLKQLPPAQPATACNADALRQKGDDHLGTGMDAAALAAFEKSMRCRPDPGLVPKAYMAACRSKNAAKAKQYFAQLPTSRQQSLAIICTRLGIAVEPEAVAATCDAVALREQGDDHLETGMDAAATAVYEKSYACRADATVGRKAYMAACRSKNGPVARKYFALLPAESRPALAQICIRFGVSVP